MIDAQNVAKIAADQTAAWNSKSAEAVASFYAENGEAIINNGEPWSGRSRVQDMAAGFYADVPDLTLTCDDVRCAGTRGWFDAEDHARQAEGKLPLCLQMCFCTSDRQPPLAPLHLIDAHSRAVAFDRP